MSVAALLRETTDLVAGGRALKDWEIGLCLEGLELAFGCLFAASEACCLVGRLNSMRLCSVIFDFFTRCQ